MNISELFQKERLKKRHDTKYHFFSAFDDETGFYWRSNEYDENLMETDKEPFMASFPHLLDIGIMGHCDHGLSGRCIENGVQCYQSGSSIWKRNMSLKDFCRIVDESKGKVFQFALGGRGDPDMHQDFESILKYSSENGIVPNLTTSGFGLTERKVSLIKKYCGAAAVSWYRTDYTYKALQQLIDAGVKTNIHFILSKSTIDEAINIIKNYPIQGVNRVIFLLFKPVGLGLKENMLESNDPKVKEFFSLFDNPEFSSKAGFDSCSVPAMIYHTKNIAYESFDACEGGRFSAYISSDMKLLPCSFDQDKKWAVSLNSLSIEEAWNSSNFNAFRKALMTACPECSKREFCMGGCPVRPEINLCLDKKKVGDDNEI